MKRALKKAKKTDSTVLLHEKDKNVKGIVYDSKFATKNNIKSFDFKYEFNILKRDIDLNKKINAKIHIQHISTSQSIDLIKKAKKKEWI